MISSKRINFIRSKLLTYTFRELYPVCSVNNKTKLTLCHLEKSICSMISI